MNNLKTALENKESKEVIISLIQEIDIINDECLLMFFDKYLYLEDFIDIVDVILTKECNLNVLNENGETLLFMVVDFLMICINPNFKKNAEYILSFLLDNIDEEHRNKHGQTYLDWNIFCSLKYDEFLINLIKHPKHKKYFYNDYKNILNENNGKIIPGVTNNTLGIIIEKWITLNKLIKKGQIDYIESKKIIDEAIDIMLSRLNIEEVIKNSILYLNFNVLYYLHHKNYNIKQEYFDELFMEDIKNLINHYEEVNGDYKQYIENYLFPPFEDITRIIKVLSKQEYYDLEHFKFDKSYQFSNFMKNQIKKFPIFNEYFLIDDYRPDDEYCKENFELAYNSAIKLINN